MAVSHGWNTSLEMGDAASPEVFTAIATVKAVTPPQLSLASIDVTHLKSTNGHREYISGMRDSGSVGFTLEYQPDEATHMNSGTGLLAKMVARTVHNFQITLSDASSNVIGPFAAFVETFNWLEVAPDASLMASCSLKITAEPTLP